MERATLCAATAAVLLGLALMQVGCAGGLTLTRINSEQKKPNNVWVFFTVKQDDDD